VDSKCSLRPLLYFLDQKKRDCTNIEKKQCNCSSLLHREKCFRSKQSPTAPFLPGSKLTAFFISYLSHLTLALSDIWFTVCRCSVFQSVRGWVAVACQRTDWQDFLQLILDVLVISISGFVAWRRRSTSILIQFSNNWLDNVFHFLLLSLQFIGIGLLVLLQPADLLVHDLLNLLLLFVAQLTPSFSLSPIWFLRL